jgi:hypothetical protein
MSGRARLFLAVLAGVVLVVGTTAAFATVAVMRDGNIEVDVRGEDGDNFSLTVPASLVRAALTFAPTVHGEQIDTAMAEVRPHWPLVRAACAQLAQLPDGVLVEVKEGDGGHVVVAKQDGDLVVRVQDGGGRVRVRVPASALEDAVDAVGRMAHLD